tara:strand:- start:649 stop:855 length:207 start_codon:yes stop_codon:yes gene_type:complete
MRRKNVYADVRTGDLVRTGSGEIGIIVDIISSVYEKGRLKRMFIDPNIYHVLVENECITLIREGFKVI